MTIINATTLTTFVVSPDGSTISINVIDEDSGPGSLVLPAECLRELIMSLPEMMRRALRRRYHDPTLRLVYPLGNWCLECTESGELLLTLATTDGFEVTFAVIPEDLEQFASAARRTQRN